MSMENFTRVSYVPSWDRPAREKLLYCTFFPDTSGVSGDLLVDGAVRNEEWFKRVSCYLTQDDRLPMYMSVQEAMMMVAQLRMPRTQSAESKKETIRTILKQLKLHRTQTTRVERLSGGERRRLSIALELLNNPPVFFLDEPTSGLDDVSAKHTVRLLLRLAIEGRTVVITIHQPSALLLQNFHMMYIVAAGQCVYQGSPQSLLPFLNTMELPCPITHNPADYIIELVDNEKANNITKLCNAVQNGLRCEDISDSSQETTSSKRVLEKKDSVLDRCSWIKLKDLPKGKKIQFINPQWYQFIILTKRSFKLSVHNKRALIIQTFHYAIFALTLGGMYCGNGDNGVSMENHVKFWIGMSNFFGTTRLFVPVILFPPQLKIAKKEYFNRWYGVGPFYMAATVGELPVQLLFSLMYMILVYYLSGIPVEMWRFWMYMLIAVLESLTVEGIGLAFATTVPALAGILLASLLDGPFLGMAIYGLDFAKQIPPFMKILMLLSPIRASLVAFILITFGFGRKPLQCYSDFCPFNDPKAILNFIDMYDNQIYVQLAAMVASLVFYRLIAYIGLRRRFAT